jgi:hypothetical protein
MLVFMLIVIVLIGVAYADFCLVSNTAHFGICFEKVAEAEKRRTGDGLVAASDLEEVSDVVPLAVPEPESAGEEEVIPGSLPRTGDDANGIPVLPQRNPAPAWLLLDHEPVLELHEKLAEAG